MATLTKGAPIRTPPLGSAPGTAPKAPQKDTHKPAYQDKVATGYLAHEETLKKNLALMAGM